MKVQKVQTQVQPHPFYQPERTTAVSHRRLILRCLPCVMFATVPLGGLAQPNSLSPNTAIESQRLGTPNGGWLPLPSFKFIPIPGAQKASESDAQSPKRPPSQQRIVDLNTAGEYQTVGTAGLELMAKEKPDDELQLIIANSLAWTGRLRAAIPAYEALTSGPLASAAQVGLANVHRWRGRDDIAKPLYDKVLAVEPENPDAIEGLELANRELSPRTLIEVGGSTDSTDNKRRILTTNHRWRDQSGAKIYEVEASGVQDSLPGIEAAQQEVTLRHHDLSLELKPSLELSMPTRYDHSLYASGAIKLADDQITLEAGRVNWSRIATNPNALRASLAATHLGASATQDFSMGTVQGKLHYYNITDGNTIFTTNLHLASVWRPLGDHFKPFAGIETRSAKFNTSNYWSPELGSGILYAGLLGEWGDSNSNLFASAQLGSGIYGEAGSSWSISAGGKHWLSNDVAIGMNLWAMSSWRDGSVYKAQSVNLNLEKLWR